MPSRIIREGFVDSESVCALSDWTHRVYTNLLLKCDDAGRFDGRPEFLRSHLFPLGTPHRASEVEASLAELVEHRLIIRYQFGRQDYIQVTHWQRTGSATKSKFPWKDGTTNIDFEWIETRQEQKQFVKTSVLPTKQRGSRPPPEGVPTPPNDRIPNNELPLGESAERGTVKPPKEPVPPSPKRQLTDAWMAAYEKFHGVKYLFQGAKDGLAADKLLKLDLPVEKIIEIARAAWENPEGFNCKQASELARFAACFNAIRTEITVLRNGKSKPKESAPIYKQIQGLEEEISLHPANHDSLAHNPRCTPEQKEHLKNLRARLKALKGAQ